MKDEITTLVLLCESHIVKALNIAEHTESRMALRIALLDAISKEKRQLRVNYLCDDLHRQDSVKPLK